MLTRFTMDVAGERQVSRAFDVLERDGRDLTEPLTAVGEILKADTGRQFESEGAHSLGGKWQDLTDDYKHEKEERVGFIYPILVSSRRMRESLVTHGVREVGPRRLVFGPDPSATYDDGTKVEDVALAHQTGAGRLPQRKIIALSEPTKRLIDREFVEFFSAKTRALIGR